MPTQDREALAQAQARASEGNIAHVAGDNAIAAQSAVTPTNQQMDFDGLERELSGVVFN